MAQKRKSKVLKPVILQLGLVGLFVSALVTSYDVSFNHFMDTPTLGLHLQNYYGLFFGLGGLVSVVGLIFVVIWALSQRNQVGRAGWYKNAYIVTAPLTLIAGLLSDSVARIDCGSSCGWAVAPSFASNTIAVTATIFWLGVSMAIYGVMLNNSSLSRK